MPASEPHAALIERACPFITFYSFKGGVGRSMALINVAGILAARGFRVLVVDMDLEAPGLSFLADPNVPEGGEPTQLGFVDFLLDAVDRGLEADLFWLPPEEAVLRYTAPYELPEGFRRTDDGSLRIMPAGRLDAEYSERLNRLNLPGLYSEGDGLALIKTFKLVVQESQQFDYVFIDSRTGFSDESGICTRDLADYLMVVSGLNKQNVEGTTNFLETLRKSVDERKPLQVILSPIPNGEDALVDEREKVAQAAFSEAWGEPVVTDLQIPYHPQLALTEEPHIFRRRRGYLFDAYNRIERSLLRLVGRTFDSALDEAVDAIREKDYTNALARFHEASRRADSDDWGGQALFRVELAGLADPGADAVCAFLFSQISADRRPRHVARIGGYASFEWFKRNNADVADAMFRRALELDPRHPIILDNYATFLHDAKKDVESAVTMYQRALEADPTHAEILGNYARALLSSGSVTEGLEVVRRSLGEISVANRPSAIDAECWMYVYCCDDLERQPEALRRLRALIEVDSVRTDEWDFSGVIERAVALEHPEAAWLPKLAEVLGGRQAPDHLEEWDAWRLAGGTGPLPHSQ
jgi:cellulose biosynthesis protein BcsQ